MKLVFGGTRIFKIAILSSMLTAIFSLFFLSAAEPGETIKLYEAGTIKPYQAETIKPYQSETIKPTRTDSNPPASGDAHAAGEPANPDYAFHTFRLRIPGAVYTTPSASPGYDTLHTSAGVQTQSIIKINPDGTYIWKSHWDGRTIHGKWVAKSDGSITVLNGEQHKDWTLGKSGKGTWGGGDIYMTGQTWYSGDRIR